MALGEWVSLLGCAQKSAGEPESPPPPSLAVHLTQGVPLSGEGAMWRVG